MRQNPWNVRLIALAVIAGVAFLATSTINVAAQGNVYSTPAPEGVLMPRVETRVVKKEDVADVPKEKVPSFRRRLKFVVPNAQIDPVSFVSLTKDVGVRIVSVTPIKETKQDDRGKSIMLMIDNSYSMVQPSPPSPWNDNWLPRSDPEYKRIDACEAMLKELSEKDRVALATFPRLNPNPGYRIPRVEPPALLHGFGQPGDILPQLEQMRERENSGTPLYRCMRFGIEWMSAQKDRPKMMVVLTDGRDTTGNGKPSEALRQGLTAANIKVFIVALGPSPDLESLGQVADEVIQVDDSGQLVDAFKKLAARFETLTVGHNVVLDIVRKGEDFIDDEDVVVGFRSDGKPEKMTLKAGGQP